MSSEHFMKNNFLKSIYHYHHCQPFLIHFQLIHDGPMQANNVQIDLDGRENRFSYTFCTSINYLLKFTFFNVLLVFTVHNEWEFFFFLFLDIVFKLTLFMNNRVIIRLHFGIFLCCLVNNCTDGCYILRIWQKLCCNT